MAEILRIADPRRTAATPALPQNVEAEAALLGALMIDNRLVEDVQLKLQPSISSSRCTAASTNRSSA